MFHHKKRKAWTACCACRLTRQVGWDSGLVIRDGSQYGCRVAETSFAKSVWRERLAQAIHSKFCESRHEMAGRRYPRSGKVYWQVTLIAVIYHGRIGWKEDNLACFIRKGRQSPAVMQECLVRTWDDGNELTIDSIVCVKKGDRVERASDTT